MLIRKTNTSIQFPTMTKKTIGRLKIKGNARCRGQELQKAHVTGEFVIVAKNGGHIMCHLASSIATVV